MRVVVSAVGADLSAEVSPVFGRCPNYVFVDTATMEFEALPNPAMSAAGGAGIQAAQFAVSKGVQAVITGNVGPNAFNVLQAAGVTLYPVSGGTVQQAVDAYNRGELQPLSGATSAMHGGMGGGMGRGMGRGMGGGMGYAMGGGASGAPAPPPATSSGSSEVDLSELNSTIGALKDQLDQLMKRIDELEKKE